MNVQYRVLLAGLFLSQVCPRGLFALRGTGPKIISVFGKVALLRVLNNDRTPLDVPSGWNTHENK